MRRLFCQRIFEQIIEETELVDNLKPTSYIICKYTHFPVSRTRTFYSVSPRSVALIQSHPGGVQVTVHRHAGLQTLPYIIGQRLVSTWPHRQDDWLNKVRYPVVGSHSRPATMEELKAGVRKAIDDTSNGMFLRTTRSFTKRQ